ncbi:membrane protein insertase YidC [Candidatus Babeliales bacterium]|nr:membrane protein insertase YidC [Candidatus Babeliales bacterium]
MDRKFFYSMMFSTVAVLALQYYFSSNNTNVATVQLAGQSFKAPVVTDIRPLFKELDFIDDEKLSEEVLTTIETENLVVKFSNHGGAPVSVVMKKHTNKQGNGLQMFDYTGYNEREKRSFALIMGDDAAAAYNYVLNEKTDNSVTFIARTKEWDIIKKYEFSSDSYVMNLELSVEPRSAQVESVTPRLFISGPFIEGLVDNTVNGFVQKTDAGSFEKVSSSQEEDWFWVSPYCLGMEDRYSAQALISDPQKFVKRAYYKRVEKKQLQIVFEGHPVEKKTAWNLSFYVGPKTLEGLSSARDDLEGLLSFGWLSAICKWLLFFLQWLYRYFQNYGIAIVALTALIKSIFLPFMIFAKGRMEEMQKYQPALDRIKNKYKSDVQKQQEETMRFYKEHNLSPITQMLGCLPLFLQLPVFFALQRALSNYIELYQAPFFGWITDLSVKDPYYVLPILVGLVMLIQQVYTPTKDPKQRFVMLFLPFVITAVFMNLSAGIVLYWLSNNIFTMMEDKFRRTFFA